MAYALRLFRPTAYPKNFLFPYVATKSLQPIVTSSSSGTKQNENFWEKNKRLARPLSPHLTIYKIQLTSTLSLTHRGTGMAMAAGLYGFSLGMLLLPANFPHYICLLQSMNIGPLIFLTKFGFATVFFYHFCNGIRHLAWDFGYGFELPDLYRSGYIVVAAAVILGCLAAMK